MESLLNRLMRHHAERAAELEITIRREWGIDMPMHQSREASAAKVLDALRGWSLRFGQYRPFAMILRDIVTAYGGTPTTYQEDVLAQQILGLIADTPASGHPQSLTATFDQIAVALGLEARGSVEANLDAWRGVAVAL